MKVKKWLALLCSLALLAGLSVTGATLLSAATAEFTVSDNGVYVMDSINARPVTMEAVIKFPKQDTSGRLGILLGNWVYPQGHHIDYKIESDGNLRIEWGTASASEKLEFTNVNVFTGEWLHLAVVADIANGKVHCYIDGELVQSKTTARTSVPNCTNPFAIGNNPRQGNGYNFRGAIKSIALYDDIRTEDEIAADMKRYGKDGLLMHVDMTGLREGATLTETVSGKKIAWEQKWFDKREPVGDYDYSMAVLGDPQTITKQAAYADTNLSAIYNYVKENVETRKIKQVFTLGDLTDTKTGKDSEWVSITNAMDILNGVVPHNMLRGNHDEPTFYDEYITVDRYGEGVVTKDGTMNSYYRLLEIGTTDYMMMILPYNPSDEERAWAYEQIAAHPNHRVIIATHSYLDQEGSKTTDGGTNIWADIAKQHANVVLVLAGHAATENIVKVTSKGVNGNTVTQLLVDQQDVDQPIAGGTGLIAFLYFSDNGRHVEIEYYSVLRDQYYKMTNQIEFDLDIPWDTTVPAFTVDAEVCAPQENSADASVLRFENGDLAVDARALANGYRYTLTAKPKAGYALATLKVTDANGNELSLLADNTGVYTFDSAIGGKVVATFAEGSAEIKEQFAFDANFAELAALAADSAYTDGKYKAPSTDTAVNNWANSKFGVFLNRESGVYHQFEYLCQPSDDFDADSTYSGNMQWQLVQGQGLGLTVANKSGQLMRKSLTLTAKNTDGTFAELSDFEAEVVFNKGGKNNRVGGVYISFHEKYPGRASFSSSKTPTSKTGDVLVVGNALATYSNSLYGSEISVIAGAYDMTDNGCREGEVFTGVDWDVSADYRLYLKVEGTMLTWSLTNLSTNTLVASGTDDTPGGSGTVSVGVASCMHTLKSFKVKSLGGGSQPVNTALVAGNTVMVNTADGYQLKAGSLVVTDANGDRFVPERVGFREGGDATQYTIPADAVAPYTVEAQFVQPAAEHGYNIGFLGTSVHEGNKGLRFVHRVAIDKDGYMLYDGQKVKVAEYGVLMAASSVLVDANALNLSAAADNRYILRFAWPEANKYYDKCDAYADLSIQVKGIGGTINETLNLHSRVYVILENGTTVYATPVTANYKAALPENKFEPEVDFGEIFG